MNPNALCSACEKPRWVIVETRADFEGGRVTILPGACPHCGTERPPELLAIPNAVPKGWKPDHHRLTTRAQQDLGLTERPFGVGTVRRPPDRD